MKDYCSENLKPQKYHGFSNETKTMVQSSYDRNCLVGHKTNTTNHPKYQCLFCNKNYKKMTVTVPGGESFEEQQELYHYRHQTEWCEISQQSCTTTQPGVYESQR